MGLIEVNQNTCHQDGLCAQVCPANLIAFNQGEFPTPIAEIDDLCIRCGHCVAICPNTSLHHTEIHLEQCPPINDELLLSPEKIEQFLRGRRSIRNYLSKEVPKELLQKLIELARYAPTGHNSQSVEWLVLTNRDELDSLIAQVGDWMRWMIANMPEFALSMHMDRALDRMDAGEDVILRGAPALIVAHAHKDDMMAPASCTIALTHLELATAGMELGGCWAGYFNAAVTSFPPMKKALLLPDGHQCFGAMMIGYPEFRFQRLVERKSPNILWRT